MNPEIFRPPDTRLVSIDALRGLTMFFIIGGEGIINSLFKIWPNQVTEALSGNMEHAGWEGFYFYGRILGCSQFHSCSGLWSGSTDT